MKVIVTDLDGKEHSLDGKPGWSAMEVIREGGLPIRADCGGCCSCATCHVYVDADWLAKSGTANDDEDALLDDSLMRRPNSRLSCQIELSDALDGLRLTLTEDAVD